MAASSGAWRSVGTSGATRAGASTGFVLGPPVRLEQDAVDLLEVDGLGAVADSLEQRADAEVASRPEDTLAGADDEAESVVGESAVSEGDAVELGKDEAAGDSEETTDNKSEFDKAVIVIETLAKIVGKLSDSEQLAVAQMLSDKGIV